jgi:hypothetical protein
MALVCVRARAGSKEREKGERDKGKREGWNVGMMGRYQIKD